jgi:transcriptional antiterminator Rof (Rho-off)
MIKHYIPIACALHDRYEMAIMQKTRINIAWIDGDGREHEENVVPKDIVVKNSEEFLLFLDSKGDERTIRLDHITLLDE